MKKSVTVLTTVILCVACLLVGAAASLVIVHEIRDEFRPDYANYIEQTNLLDAPAPPTENVPTQAPPAENNPKSVDTSAFIGTDKAKSIALEKAGIPADGVIFDRIELDRDDGVWQYEVEFRKDRTEYDIDISATDGTIRSWDVDRD